MESRNSKCEAPASSRWRLAKLTRQASVGRKPMVLSCIKEPRTK
jgi:hypothetical protein